ncbi:MAG: DNA-binding MarR family transcriptional regulator [Flavobacteriales bacterium]|jgi:DNA-binding MarR family transcriptional regulator
MIENQYIADHCQCAKLRSATRVITRLYDDALRPLGIKASQFTVLVAVDLCTPISITDLSEALSMERTTLTRNLAPLEKDGLIQMNSGKGRTRYASLTKPGKTLLAEAKPLWKSTQTKVNKSLGKDDSQTLNSILKKLKVNFN